MNLRRAEFVLVSCNELFDGELVKETLEILEVGQIAGSTEHCRAADRLETLDGLEASERSVRGWLAS